MNIFFDFDKMNITLVDMHILDMLLAIRQDLRDFLKDYETEETKKGFILIRLFTKEPNGVILHFPDKNTMRILSEATGSFDIENLIKKYTKPTMN